MSIEVEVLSEMYTILKQYIPTKDRQEAADNLMSVMVDMLNDLDLREFGGTDSTLKRALKEYSADEEDEDDNYNYED
jgi:DNA-binding transcriptional regulator GbsR (MarR family)